MHAPNPKELKKEHFLHALHTLTPLVFHQVLDPALVTDSVIKDSGFIFCGLALVPKKPMKVWNFHSLVDLLRNL